MHGVRDAELLLVEWVASEQLRKHCRGAAICAAGYGALEADRLRLVGNAREEFVELYTEAGLLHDFDYERHPTAAEHPFVGVAYLRAHGWPEEILRAILAHADYTGVVPESHLDRALFACDELSGFLTACALVKPAKRIAEVEVAGVRKKMKDKGFARAVSRDDIVRGAELPGVTLDQHIGNCLTSMQAHADVLAL